MIKRFITSLVCLAFITSYCQPVYAQDFSINQLPMPGKMISTTPAFVPLTLKGMVIHPENALKFDFLMDTGHSRLQGQELSAEALKIMKYFLTALTIPEDDLWVNLSPYEKGRIIQDNFGQTIMGRDLLAQDYILKQLTSSLIYPEKALGREFWQQVYSKAAKEYGTTQIPVNTFNKVWIVPSEAVVWEHEGKVLIVKSHLKVMLEEDYLSLQKHSGVEAPQGNNAAHSIGSQIVRNLVLPVLEKEVNEGKNFAQLRQMFQAMILATWYKKALKTSILNKVYADRSKIQGLSPTRGHVPEGDVSPSRLPSDEAMNVKAPQSNEPNDVEAIYQRYLKAFKKGAFNYIKEDVDPSTGQTIPRKYFSGGINGTELRTHETEWHGAIETLPADERRDVEAAAIAVDQTLLVKGALDEFGTQEQPTPGALTGNSAMIAHIVSAAIGSLAVGGAVFTLIAIIQKKINPNRMVNFYLERVKSPNPLMRENAVKFLGKNGDRVFMDLLLELAQKDPDSDVQVQATRAFNQLRIPAALKMHGLLQISSVTTPTDDVWHTAAALLDDLFEQLHMSPDEVLRDNPNAVEGMPSNEAMLTVPILEYFGMVESLEKKLDSGKDKVRRDAMAAIDRLSIIDKRLFLDGIYLMYNRALFNTHEEVRVWGTHGIGSILNNPKLAGNPQSERYWRPTVISRLERLLNPLRFNGEQYVPSAERYFKPGEKPREIKEERPSMSDGMKVAAIEELVRLSDNNVLQGAAEMAGMSIGYIPQGKHYYYLNPFSLVFRPGHEALRRAAARTFVKYGNKEVLVGLLQYPDKNIRQGATTRLIKELIPKGEATIEDLKKGYEAALAVEAAREEAIEGLRELKLDGGVENVKNNLALSFIHALGSNSGNYDLWGVAAEELGLLGDPKAVKALLTALEGANPQQDEAVYRGPDFYHRGRFFIEAIVALSTLGAIDEARSWAKKLWDMRAISPAAAFELKARIPKEKLGQALPGEAIQAQAGNPNAAMSASLYLSSVLAFLQKPIELHSLTPADLQQWVSNNYPGLIGFGILVAVAGGVYYFVNDVIKTRELSGDWDRSNTKLEEHFMALVKRGDRSTGELIAESMIPGHSGSFYEASQKELETLVPNEEDRLSLYMQILNRYVWSQGDHAEWLWRALGNYRSDMSALQTLADYFVKRQAKEILQRGDPQEIIAGLNNNQTVTLEETIAHLKAKGINVDLNIEDVNRREQGIHPVTSKPLQEMNLRDALKEGIDVLVTDTTKKSQLLDKILDDGDPDIKSWANLEKLRMNADFAMSHEQEQLNAKTPGGIALNAKMMDLQIKRDGHGVPLPISQQPLDKINLQGFVPQIISIQPVDLATLLGLSGQSGALTGP